MTARGAEERGVGAGGVERRRSQTGAAPTLQVRLLGGLELSWQGQPLAVSAPRLRALIAYLALEGASSRDTLRGLLWPELGSQPLRQALHALRGLPGAAEWLQTEPSVRLLVTTDVQAFRQRCLSEDGAPIGSAPARLLPDLDLENVPTFQDWLEEQRRGLGELWRTTLRAELHRTGRHDPAHDPERARRAARQLTLLDPTDEVTARHWMRLEAEAGDLERCAEVFQACRSALRAELDSEPGEETLALLRQLEGQSAAHDQPGRWVQEGGEDQEPLLGRTEALGAARRHLHASGRVLLHGLAGIGKTRLAQALATELAAADGGRVLWLTLGDDPPESVLPRLLGLLGGRPTPRLLPTQLRETLQNARLSGLILDDAWNSHTVQSLQGALPSTLPVVLTSRQRHGGWPRVLLDRLERPASLRLLRGQGEAEVLPSPPPAAQDALCALLGDHPYALRLAARTLASGQLGLTALLASLGATLAVDISATDTPEPQALSAGDGSGSGDLDPGNFNPGEPGSGGTGAQQIEAGIGTLLRHSTETLSEEAYEAYLGLGALPSPASSPELLALLLRRSQEATETALFELLERGLVTRHARQGSELTSFSMHDLTWRSARRTPAYLPVSVLRAAAEYARSRSSDPDALHLDLPNLIGAARLAEHSAQQEALVALMSGLLGGSYLATHGFPAGQLPLLQAAAQAAATRQDWPASARLHGRLGDVQQALLGDILAATDNYLTAAEHAGLAHLPVLRATCTAMAGTLMAMQRRPGAEKILGEALGYARESADPVCLARVQEQSGIVRAMQKDFGAARAALLAAQNTLQPLLVPDHPCFPEAHARMYSVVRNLGQAEQRLNRLPEALALKREALAIALERGEHLNVALAHADIGEVLHLTGGHTDEARTELLGAVAMFRDLGASGQEQAALSLLAALPA